MKNYVELESSILIYDVMFNEVQYEVQMLGGRIEGMYRSDGKELFGKEREDVRDFIYEQVG